MEPLFGISWGIWGGFCFLIAALYFVIAPKPRSRGGSTQWLAFKDFTIRYAHSLVWVLLGMACFCFTFDSLQYSAWPMVFGVSALVCYILFMTIFRIDKVRAKEEEGKS